MDLSISSINIAKIKSVAIKYLNVYNGKVGYHMSNMNQVVNKAIKSLKKIVYIDNLNKRLRNFNSKKHKYISNLSIKDMLGINIKQKYHQKLLLI